MARTIGAPFLLGITFAVSALAATSAATLSAPLDIQLGFSSLPSAQGFAYAASGSHANILESSVFSVAGGVLTQNTMGQSNGVAGGSLLYQRVGGITTTESKEIRVRARCLAAEGSSIARFGQGGFLFGFAQGSVQYDFGLTPSRIFVLQPSGTLLIAGTYDNTQFHDYRFEFSSPNTFRLYRDGALIYTGSDGFAVVINRVFLGDGTGGANAKGEITSFRFIQDVATESRATTWGRLKAIYR